MITLQKHCILAIWRKEHIPPIQDTIGLRSSLATNCMCDPYSGYSESLALLGLFSVLWPTANSSICISEPERFFSRTSKGCSPGELTP